MTAGLVVEVEFTLQSVAVKLNAVVSTATGPARRVEMGNSIPVVDAVTETKLKPIANLQDLLNARAPGVQLSTGTHFKGPQYGPDVNLPVPTDERNNPNFVGCTDRNP